MKSWEDIVELVREERAAQDAKWGTFFYARSDERWLAILVEEVGEVAQSMLKEEGDEHTEVELVQIAAVVFSWLQYRTIRDEQTRAEPTEGM